MHVLQRLENLRVRIAREDRDDAVVQRLLGGVVTDDHTDDCEHAENQRKHREECVE
jgi:hypothetical protein